MKKLFIIVAFLIVSFVSCGIIRSHSEEPKKPEPKIETAKPDSLKPGKNYSKQVFSTIIADRQAKIKEIDAKIYNLEKEKLDLQKQIDLLAQLIQVMQ